MCLRLNLIFVVVFLATSMTMLSCDKADSVPSSETQHIASPTSTPQSEPRAGTPDKYGITIGTTADDILLKRKKPTQIIQQGRDSYGLAVSWVYPDVTYVLSDREKEGITAYRVIEMKYSAAPTPSPNGDPGRSASTDGVTPCYRACAVRLTRHPDEIAPQCTSISPVSAYEKCVQGAAESIGDLCLKECGLK